MDSNNTHQKGKPLLIILLYIRIHAYIYTHYSPTQMHALSPEGTLSMCFAHDPPTLVYLKKQMEEGTRREGAENNRGGGDREWREGGGIRRKGGREREKEGERERVEGVRGREKEKEGVCVSK